MTETPERQTHHDTEIMHDGIEDMETMTADTAAESQAIEETHDVVPRLGTPIIVRDPQRWATDCAAIITRVHADRRVDATVFPPGSPPEFAFNLRPIRAAEAGPGWIG